MAKKQWGLGKPRRGYQPRFRAFIKHKKGGKEHKKFQRRKELTIKEREWLKGRVRCHSFGSEKKRER